MTTASLSTAGLTLDSVCAVLYGLLTFGAAARLIQRHRQSGFPFRIHSRLLRCIRRCEECCPCSSSSNSGNAPHGSSGAPHASYYYVGSASQPGGTASNGAKKGYLVMLALFAYCLMRAVQLALFASATLDSSGDIKTNIYRFFPALGFMAVQSTMLNKWVDHVAELTLVLQHQAFGIGQFLITCSVFLVIADATLTALAFTDTAIYHFSNQPGHFWNILVNMFCGVVYAFNGVAFSGLGCFLRHLWIPVTPMGVHASKRILGIALIFGLMCIARGAILLMYIDDDASDAHVHTVTHNDWGAPAVLLCEWLSLVISLFLLTVAKHHNNSASLSVPSNVLGVGQFSAGASGFLGGEQIDERSNGGGVRTAAAAPPPPADGLPYYPRYSRDQMLSSAEISLATMASSHQSTGPFGYRANVVGGGSIVGSSSSSPFVSPRPAGGGGGGAGSHQQLRRSVDLAGLRVSMMRGGGPLQSKYDDHSTTTSVREAVQHPHDAPPQPATAASQPPDSIQGGSLRTIPQV